MISRDISPLSPYKKKHLIGNIDSPTNSTPTNSNISKYNNINLYDDLAVNIFLYNNC